MSDLISRQDAISRIQKAYIDTQEGFDKSAVKINVGLTKALHIMQDLPSAQQWIPCSERLPKPNEVVLLCGQYNMLCGYINDEGRWYSMSGDGWETDMEFPDKGKIIAWMPLPEPWKGDEE